MMSTVDLTRDGDDAAERFSREARSMVTGAQNTDQNQP